jgi:hypothetical protein
MCRKVKTAVARIENDRTRFANVDDRELQSRKAFVDNFERVRPALDLSVCGQPAFSILSYTADTCGHEGDV